MEQVPVTLLKNGIQEEQIYFTIHLLFQRLNLAYAISIKLRICSRLRLASFHLRPLAYIDNDDF